MRIFSRVFLLFLLLIVINLLPHFAKNAFAAGEFETDYNVVYSVGNSGNTDVTQDIVLKNKTSNYYADKFELKIGSTKINDVKASDSAGPLETNVKFEDNLTTITVKFNQRVIGIDKTLPWKLSYSSNELATKSGQIWEVSIPRLSKTNEIASYTTTVKIPVSFGPVAFAIPEPKNQIKLPDRQEFLFDKDQLFQSGIAMSFGEKQVFSFNLNYYLENNNVTTQLFQIALPPDNNYQRVVLEKIDPPPIDVVVDEDGNFLAKYRIPPRGKLDITAQGFVEVFSKSVRNISGSLSQDDRQKYTQPERYWETDNANIKDKAKELKTPKQIYDFVTNYLTYSQKRLEQAKIERMGAASALTSPKEAVCMEFTDLFIAIARAADIPAREVEGFSYTQNERLRPLSLALPQGDILHAWPEYWDDQLGWVQIDPTWGSTSGGLDYFSKLDFNHVTFVQRGLSSVNPQPAGSYKREEDLGKKTVNVSFAQELPTPTLTPKLSLSIPSKIISGLPVRIIASVENIGSTSIIDQQVNLTSNKLMDDSSGKIDLKILPPYAKKDFIFRLHSKNLFSNFQDTIVLTFANSQIAKPVQILPIYKIFFSQGFILAIIAVTVIILTGHIIYRKFLPKKFKFPQI